MHLNSSLGSSLITSSAYQKWSTKDSNHIAKYARSKHIETHNNVLLRNVPCYLFKVWE